MTSSLRYGPVFVVVFLPHGRITSLVWSVCYLFVFKVDLEDEVGIDEESIAPFTALLISFNRFVALGRGKFRIPY